MKSYRYRVVDVFTTTPLEGNPLAVFPNAAGLDGTTMQKIAKEMNLAETAFVVPSKRGDCAIGVRIFTPGKEMAFAGHPTLGTSFVLLEEGIVALQGGCFRLEELVGPVPVRVHLGLRPMFWLTTPPIREGRLYDRSLCAEALGLDSGELLDKSPQLLDAGNPTLLIAAASRSAVDKAWLDLGSLRRLKGADQEPICVFLFTPTPEGAYSRMFAPEYGVAEDAATGSSTGPLAWFMMKHGLTSSRGGSFISEQGVKMGRRSLLHVRINGESGQDGIEVGGFVTPVVEATLHLPGADQT